MFNLIPLVVWKTTFDENQIKNSRSIDANYGEKGCLMLDDKGHSCLLFGTCETGKIIFIAEILFFWWNFREVRNGVYHY